jgi:hypothetical protein
MTEKVIQWIEELEKKIFKIDIGSVDCVKIEERLQELAEKSYNLKRAIIREEQNRKAKEKENRKEVDRLKTDIKMLKVDYFCFETTYKGDSIKSCLEELPQDKNICLMKFCQTNSLFLVFNSLDNEWRKNLVKDINFANIVDDIYYVYNGEDFRAIMEKILRNHFHYLRVKGLIEDEEEDDLGQMYEDAGIEW